MRIVIHHCSILDRCNLEFGCVHPTYVVLGTLEVVHLNDSGAVRTLTQQDELISGAIAQYVDFLKLREGLRKAQARGCEWMRCSVAYLPSTLLQQASTPVREILLVLLIEYTPSESDSRNLVE